MRIISFDEILTLAITPEMCLTWAEDVIKNKNKCILPPKNSIKFGNNNNCFFNTMPSFIPFLNRFGVKEVSRFVDRKPALKADILLYDSQDGDLLSCMDGTWITTMRTGAVAAITIDKLESESANIYSFIGLGNTARATLLCLNAIKRGKNLRINLLAYKDQHDIFMQRFSNYTNIEFKVFNNIKAMINQSDVIISCVTAANSCFAEPGDFKPGCLVVPVHTKGFQNCDLEFDKIYCDDIPHIEGFKYFKEYKFVKEMTEVLNDTSFVRSPNDRILAYNIGISVQDIYFASKIFDLISANDNELKNKFWV